MEIESQILKKKSESPKNRPIFKEKSNLKRNICYIGLENVIHLCYLRQKIRVLSVFF
jgi:hypothetical protein